MTQSQKIGIAFYKTGESLKHLGLIAGLYLEQNLVLYEGKGLREDKDLCSDIARFFSKFWCSDTRHFSFNSKSFPIALYMFNFRDHRIFPIRIVKCLKTNLKTNSNT